MLNRNTIKSLLKKGLLSEIDIHFARFITGLSPDHDPDIFLAAALVSHVTGKGDICLNLDTAAGKQLSGTQDFWKPIECPELMSGSKN